MEDGNIIAHGYDGSKDFLYNLKSEAGRYKPKLLAKQGTLL